MERIRYTLFTGWHMMRWVRLAFGVFFLIQAVQMKDVLMGVAGGFFLLTSLANLGCCGSRGCAVPMDKKDDAP